VYIYRDTPQIRRHWDRRRLLRFGNVGVTNDADELENRRLLRACV